MEYIAYENIANKIIALITSVPVTLRDIRETVMSFLEGIDIQGQLNIEDANEATSIPPDIDLDFDWKPQIDLSSEVIKMPIRQYIERITN